MKSFLRLGVLLLCASTSAQSLFPAPASDWRSLDLSSRPLNIAENQGILWVCGADELITKSTDGGRTWTNQHFAKNGSILLTISFANPKFGYAAGLGGTLLFTRDAGDTWSRVTSPDPVIYAASFSDDKHGLLHTPHTIFQTSDGGQSWVPVPIELTSDEGKPFAFVLALQALDAQHMLIVVSRGNSYLYPSKYLVTKDGGVRWKFVDIPSTGFRSISTSCGEYWFVGYEVIEKDKPGGGYGVPLVMHSSDGEVWVRLPRWAQKEFSVCNPQGCLYWNGAGIKIPAPDQPSFWTFDPDKSLTHKWAIAQKSICSVSTELRCAPLTEVASLPSYPKGVPAIGDPIAPPPLNAPTKERLQCLICGVEHFVVTQSYQGLAEVDLKLHIGANGLVQEVEVVKSPSGEVSDKILPTVRSWIFLPYIKDGSSTSVVSNLKLQVQAIKPH